MSLNRLFERAVEVGQNAPTVNPRHRMAEHADALNRAGLLQAQLDVCVAALVALVKLLYQTDGDGTWANLDHSTGRILIPVPWGSRGYQHWNLRKWEAGCLRQVLMAQGQQQRVVFFDYSPETRQWYIDLQLFPTMESALLWLWDHQPTLVEWRPVVDAYRAQAQKRMRARRDGRSQT